MAKVVGCEKALGTHLGNIGTAGVEDINNLQDSKPTLGYQV